MPDSKQPISSPQDASAKSKKVDADSIEDQVDQLLGESARILEEAKAVADEQTNIAKPADDASEDDATESESPATDVHEQPGEEPPTDTAPIENVNIEEVDELIAQAAGEAIEKEDDTLVAASAAPPAPAPPPATTSAAPPAKSPAPATSTSSDDTPAPAATPAPATVAAKTEEKSAPTAAQPADTDKPKSESKLVEIAHRAQAIEKRIEALPFMPVLSRLTRNLLAVINSPWEAMSPTLRTLLLTMAAANAFVAVSACFIAIWRIL